MSAMEGVLDAQVAAEEEAEGTTRTGTAEMDSAPEISVKDSLEETEAQIATTIVEDLAGRVAVMVSFLMLSP